MTTPEPPPAVVAGPLPASSACRRLPFYRFTAASSSSPPPWFPSSPSPSPTPAPPVTATSRAPTAMAAAAQQEPTAAGGDASPAAAAAEVEEKMDLLWEDFNEELARGRGGSYRARATGPEARDLWSSGSSDAESSEPAAILRGCAPVLRPSSRAGGAVRNCRRRAGTWVLLMRIFRRLFVIEKTTVSAARRRHAAATTRAS